MFQLLDVVEENTSNQVRRRADDPRRREGEPGFWLWNLNDLRQRGFSEEEVRQAMRGVSAEPVLTAHPTEAKRATVLEHHRTLYLLLVERDNRNFTEVELAIFERRMKAALERLWRTGEIRQERPDIASEVTGVLHYLRTVFPEAVELLDLRFQHCWRAVFGTEPPPLPGLAVGSWVGGDRDGHPFVTPAVTAETLELLRKNALVVVRERLLQLGARLSMAEANSPVPQPLQDRIAELAAKLGEHSGRSGARPQSRRTMAATGEPDAGAAGRCRTGLAAGTARGSRVARTLACMKPARGTWLRSTCARPRPWCGPSASIWRRSTSGRTARIMTALSAACSKPPACRAPITRIGAKRKSWSF